MEVCTITGDVRGVPSPELRQMLASAGVPLYAPFLSAEPKRELARAGFNR